MRDRLQKHETEGGISMKCGHPRQCAYAAAPEDGGNGCSMCDQDRERATMKVYLDPDALQKGFFAGWERGRCYQDNQTRASILDAANARKGQQYRDWLDYCERITEEI